MTTYKYVENLIYLTYILYTSVYTYILYTSFIYICSHRLDNENSRILIIQIRNFMSNRLESKMTTE